MKLTMISISQSEARRNGDSQYSTGKPCKNGHTAPRWTASGNCSECLWHYAKARRDDPIAGAKLKERARHSRRRTKYGLEEADFRAMYIAQGAGCAVCQKPVEEGRIHVDHCHATGKVRELLCHSCNTALGAVNDNVDILQRLAAYIVKHRLAS